jgi:hypothetical protein
VDGDDAHHEACLELLETHPGPLVVPTLVITEVAYLIASRLGWQAETRFLGDLAAGEMSLEPVAPKDTLRIAELVARYHDLPLGTVDASSLPPSALARPKWQHSIAATSPLYARTTLRRSISSPAAHSSRIPLLASLLREGQAISTRLTSCHA